MGYILYLCFHKSVLVAVDVEKASAAEVKAGFGITLGIEFYKLYPIASHIAHKGDVVALCHFVADGNKMLVLHLFDCNFVGFVTFLGFKGREGYSAAAHYRVAHGAYDVVAQRTDVKF